MYREPWLSYSYSPSERGIFVSWHRSRAILSNWTLGISGKNQNRENPLTTVPFDPAAGPANEMKIVVPEVTARRKLEVSPSVPLQTETLHFQ